MDVAERKSHPIAGCDVVLAERYGSIIDYWKTTRVRDTANMFDDPADLRDRIVDDILILQDDATARKTHQEPHEKVIDVPS